MPIDLVERTMEDLQEFFEKNTNHQPSDLMYDHMRLIPETMWKMVQGKAEQKLYLSQLDAGVGKTTALKFSMKHMGQYVGTILCLGTYAQIEKMIIDLELDPASFSVFVKDGVMAQDPALEGKELIKLGIPYFDADRVPILITTHSMLESRLRYRSFNDAKEFFYRGEPRPLRVYDESIFIRDGITIRRSSLSCIEVEGGELFNVTDDFKNRIREANNGDVLIFPDYKSICPVQEAFDLALPKYRNTVQDIWFLSDRIVRVRKDENRQDNGGINDHLITYTTVLPDIYPILCLDASAAVRTTYNQQHEADNNVIWLGGRQRVKKYDNVTVRFEEGSAKRAQKGKSYWAKVRDIATIIKAHADRKALVLHHLYDPDDNRRHRTPDWQTHIKQRLTEDEQARVKWCTWNRHTASNEYGDCNLIIVASILRLPSEVIEARGRAALNVPPNLDYPKDAMREMRQGEIKHDLYQGLARGSLRNCIGDQAQECLIYLMADRQSGVKGLLPDIFPGCNVVDGWWNEENLKPLTGRSKEILDFITQMLTNGGSINFPDVYGPLGISKQNFSAYIKDLKPYLEQLGLQIYRSRPSYISH